MCVAIGYGANVPKTFIWRQINVIGRSSGTHSCRCCVYHQIDHSTSKIANPLRKHINHNGKLLIPNKRQSFPNTVKYKADDYNTCDVDVVWLRLAACIFINMEFEANGQYHPYELFIFKRNKAQQTWPSGKFRLYVILCALNISRKCRWIFISLCIQRANGFVWLSCLFMHESSNFHHFQRRKWAANLFAAAKYLVNTNKFNGTRENWINWAYVDDSNAVRCVLNDKFALRLDGKHFYNEINCLCQGERRKMWKMCAVEKFVPHAAAKAAEKCLTRVWKTSTSLIKLLLYSEHQTNLTTSSDVQGKRW